MSTAPFCVRSLYEYSSPHEDDLQFPPGVVITVTDEEDTDWYGGEYVDNDGVKHEGIFPRNFVEKFEPQPPPRPTRVRTKKERYVDVPAHQQPSHDPEPETERDFKPHPTRVSGPDAEVEQVGPDMTGHHKVRTSEHALLAFADSAESVTDLLPAVASAPPAITPAEPVSPTVSSVAIPVPIQPKLSGPPPVSSKPSSTAFRDRIAAFNKSAAAPIAPFQPVGLGTGPPGDSGFVKKPFVAAPPSRDAYVPPPQQTVASNVFKREEDPGIKAREVEAQETAEKVGLISFEQAGEDEPKPTSLKDRIALLQRRQLEQAQRHADALERKEKLKQPAKKRSGSHEAIEGADATDTAGHQTTAVHQQTERPTSRSSELERSLPPPRGMSSKGPIEVNHDGNEADMPGAGDTTECKDEDLTERDDSDERPRHVDHVPTGAAPVSGQRKEGESDTELDEGNDHDDDVDPEIRRKEELRARMAKMSGGMGMMGMHAIFGAPIGRGTPPKKKAGKNAAERLDENKGPIAPAPPNPVPAMMPLHRTDGLPRPEDAAETESSRSHPLSPTASLPPPMRPTSGAEDASGALGSTSTTCTEGAEPPILGGWPGPQPLPCETRVVSLSHPPLVASQIDGSESENEFNLSGAVPKPDITEHGAGCAAPSPKDSGRRPPPVPLLGFDTLPESAPGCFPPLSSKRLSRPPPPIPGTAGTMLSAQSRPPPPPPPSGLLSRQATQEMITAIGPISSPTGPMIEDDEEEVTEYMGDYGTDIASSVLHKDALKTHDRESSLQDNTPVRFPVSEVPPSTPPPIPSSGAPRSAPPPVPTQAAPADKRQSVEAPRGAPPPPPLGLAKNIQSMVSDHNHEPYGFPQGPSFAQRAPTLNEEMYIGARQSQPSPSLTTRAPPPVPPTNRGPPRHSLDASRPAVPIRSSADAHRPSLESGFIANDIDLAAQSGWWRQANQVPPALHGRRDIHYESEERRSTVDESQTVMMRTIYILFQDYSQTVVTVQYDPFNPVNAELHQRHEPPPRALRQDQLEQSYERFGRAIASSCSFKKDSVVGDGTPQGLVRELLRPFKDALAPVGTRAYGALVYSNLANASTQQYDEIRPGDIVSIRNARFQGKHGPMHAKYSAEVGKPDHVAIVAEWDGTKRKIRAWEQGRENKKVKVESFRLDDLRSGEVKVWRLMPRSWVGWDTQL
ncbi:hypothetical protein ACRALDRAFT_1037819 [Sodiomyces alcalophilus JCM 7366]|uniref:uncharacterized protein n=1 Tax=Sodiomyces alcalophilus JCM 7366 TaxID=591952 RepID=UPI0039B54078